MCVYANSSKLLVGMKLTYFLYVGTKYERMLNPRIEQSKAIASNQFKILIIGLPGTETTHLINHLFNAVVFPYHQAKRFKVYYCTINTTTFEWEEANPRYQAFETSCFRGVIFEVVATKAIFDLLYLLIAPEDIVLIVYNVSFIRNANYMANIDYILNSVSAHCHTRCCSSELQSPPVHYPCVLMMGICTNYAPYSQTIKLFREHFNGKTYEKHILQEDKDAFHFSGYGGAYPTNKIKFLTTAILSAAEPACSKHCPSVYSQFEHAILKYGHKSFLTVAKASKIAFDIGIQTKEQQQQLYEHFRNKGIILYYPNVPALQDKIFIPQMIMNLFTAIFEASDYSLIQESFMGLEPKQQKLLVRLLKNFNLAVAGHYSQSQMSEAHFYYDNTPYTIPSFMDINALSKELRPDGYIGVIYHFSDGFLPQCVFHHLIAKLINWFCADENNIN